MNNIKGQMRMELIPKIEKSNNMPAYMQLYLYVKESVLSGRLMPHDRLPSVREWSKSLGKSRTTIENAYTQLLAEGYIYSEPQKGYFVSAYELDTSKELNHPNKKGDKEKPQPVIYDFMGEYVEDCNFNVGNWRKHINDVLVYQGAALFGPSELVGEEKLREAIVNYVYRTRGVAAMPDQIFIGAGVQPLLSVLADMMRNQAGNSIGVEDPGFNRAKYVFEKRGYKIKPIRVSSGGIDLDQLYAGRERLCYASPSHQFPTGAVMRLEARTKLIAWADEVDGYIIEDDYNSELRYEGKPIPAMKSLDRKDRVIYLGSFSTVLLPSIRISFMILPERLCCEFRSCMEQEAPMVSKLEQLALANMLVTGSFEKHIRKIRKNYARKNEYTLKLIQSYMGEWVDVMGMNSGLNALLRIRFPMDEESLLDYLRGNGILIGGISEYSLVKSKDCVLILSFRGIPTGEVENGIRLLAQLLDECHKNLT